MQPQQIYVNPPHPGFLHRYLAARGQDVGKATQALRKTLLWRKQYRPEAITFDDVAVNASGGRVEVLSELDKHKRPILLYRLRWAASLTHICWPLLARVELCTRIIVRLCTCMRHGVRHHQSVPLWPGTLVHFSAFPSTVDILIAGHPCAEQVSIKEGDYRGGVHPVLGASAGVCQQDGR